MYLAYHDVNVISIAAIGGNLGVSGYVVDGISFYYFVLEQNNGSELKLTFNLNSGSWDLSDALLDLSEKINELDKQNAINLIEFIDL